MVGMTHRKNVKGEEDHRCRDYYPLDRRESSERTKGGK